MRSLKCAQAQPSYARVAVIILAGNLEQFATCLSSQDFGQLAFAGAGVAVQQNIHAFAPGCDSFLEKRQKNTKFFFKMRVISD